MKELPSQGTKACPWMGTSLCSLCVPRGFDGTARSGMSMCYIFYQSVLGATTLAWGKAGVGGVRARARCKVGLLQGYVVISPMAKSRAGAWWVVPQFGMSPVSLLIAAVSILAGAVPEPKGQVQSGKHAGAVLAGWPEHQAVFNLLRLHWEWEQQVSIYTLPGFLKPSSKPSWFSN